MDLGVHTGNKVRSNLPKLQYTTFMIVIHWVSNSKDYILFPQPLQASYTDIRHREEVRDISNRNESQNSHTF